MFTMHQDDPTNAADTNGLGAGRWLGVHGTSATLLRDPRHTLQANRARTPRARYKVGRRASRGSFGAETSGSGSRGALGGRCACPCPSDAEATLAAMGAPKRLLAARRGALVNGSARWMDRFAEAATWFEDRAELRAAIGRARTDTLRDG